MSNEITKMVFRFLTTFAFGTVFGAGICLLVLAIWLH